MHGFKSRVARFYSTCRCPSCVTDNAVRTTEGLHHRLGARTTRAKTGGKERDAITVLLPVMLISGAILDSTYKTYKHLKLDIEIAKAQERLKQVDLDLEKTGLKDRVNLVAGYQRGLDAINEAKEEAEWERSKDGFSRLKYDIRVARGEEPDLDITYRIPAGFEVGELPSDKLYTTVQATKPVGLPLVARSFSTRTHSPPQIRQYHTPSKGLPESTPSNNTMRTLDFEQYQAASDSHGSSQTRTSSARDLTTSSHNLWYAKGKRLTFSVDTNEARDTDRSWSRFTYWKSTELQDRTNEAIVARAIYKLLLYIIDVAGGEEQHVNLGNDATIMLSDQTQPELKHTLESLETRIDQLADIPPSHQQDLWLPPLRFPGYRAENFPNLEPEEFEDYQSGQRALQAHCISVLQDPRLGIVQKLSELLPQLINQDMMPAVSIWNVLLVEFVRLGHFEAAGIILEMFEHNRWLYPTHITIEMGLRVSSLSNTAQAKSRFLNWVDRIPELDTRPSSLKEIDESTMGKSNIPDNLAPLHTPGISSELVFGYLRFKMMDKAWEAFVDYRKLHASLPISFLMHVQSEFVRKHAPWAQIWELWSIMRPYTIENPCTTCSRTMVLCMLQACVDNKQIAAFDNVKSQLGDPGLETLRFSNFASKFESSQEFRTTNLLLNRLRVTPSLPGGTIERTSAEILDDTPTNIQLLDKGANVYRQTIKSLCREVIRERNHAAGPALAVDSLFRCQTDKETSKKSSPLAQVQISFAQQIQMVLSPSRRKHPQPDLMKRVISQVNRLKTLPKTPEQHESTAEVSMPEVSRSAPPELVIPERVYRRAQTMLATSTIAKEVPAPTIREKYRPNTTEAMVLAPPRSTPMKLEDREDMLSRWQPRIKTTVKTNHDIHHEPWRQLRDRSEEQHHAYLAIHGV